MPAIYAHDRFGADVAERLDPELKEIIRKYPASYAAGLQGPDILFFYRAWGKNSVNQYGVHLHKISALPFFEHAREAVKEHGRDSREYAYLMGFICHYILDSECHPYVEQMIEKIGVQHLEIEEEFEKMLLRMDGKDAVSFPAATLVPTDEQTAGAIAPFYDERIDKKVVLQSLKDMKTIKKLFCAPGAFKQGFINSTMKLLRHHERMKGLMYQRVDNPACRESDEGLMKRYDGAIGVAAEMIMSFDESLRTGGELNARFDRTFE